jgi:Zn-dependent M16 (insulinase) family peptidase
MLASREFSNNYLYKHIRVQGGAYGGMSSFDTSLGVFSFLSYRDPHIVETLKVFEDAQSHYARQEMSAAEMEKAVISALGALDKPMDPAGRGYMAMMRHFAGATDPVRQTFRDRIFQAVPSDVKDAVADYFARASSHRAVAVYSAQEKLEEANQRLTEKLRLEKLSDL